ncbi:uncharacterized protein M6G45_001690 [Spheniscus humboldti]
MLQSDDKVRNAFKQPTLFMGIEKLSSLLKNEEVVTPSALVRKQTTETAATASHQDTSRTSVQNLSAAQEGEDEASSNLDVLFLSVAQQRRGRRKKCYLSFSSSVNEKTYF